MKNATPSERSLNITLAKLTGTYAEKISNRYRKIAKIEDYEFDFLVDVKDKEDWTPLSERKVFFQEFLKENKETSNYFYKFLKSLIKKYPEYESLILLDDWYYLLIEFFFLGEIQQDTYKSISKELVFWSENPKDKFLILKIYPGADKKDVLYFLSRKENDIYKKFKEKNIVIFESKSRAKKEESYNFDLWVRVLDTFKSEEIRDAFAIKFPTEYKLHFAPNGKRIALYRAKYELIAHYLFHRFNLKSPNKGPYKADYVKAIIEKAKKDKTQIKIGVFKQVP